MSFPAWILAHGETLQITLFFSLLIVLAVVEPVFPGHPGPMDRRMRWPANLLLTLLNFITLSVLPVSLIAASMWTQEQGWGLLHFVQLPLAALIAVNLLVRAFISFFTHFLMHKVPLLWRVHRVHHLDTQLDVTTTVRFHPLEFLVQTVPGVPIVVAFGLTPWVLVFYELLDVVMTLWTHSNLKLPVAIDRVLRYVVVTPDLHRVHHSAWQPETDSNFGAVFPLWDIVFRTFRTATREGHERMRLGLDEVRGPAAHRPLWLLGSVFAGRLGGNRNAQRRTAR
jgi:sterol desaturase/sphingolipid hydroxylase (fatty acid hydroxylase superfamily)